MSPNKKTRMPVRKNPHGPRKTMRMITPMGLLSGEVYLHESTVMRQTGLEIIGEAPWGTHFCQFYETQEDLFDILIPYFKAGLENNEYCMWVTSEPLGAESAREKMKEAVPGFDGYLKKGQMEIIPYTQWYRKGGAFSKKRVLDGWVQRLQHAVKKGYDGLRLTGNTFWLEKKEWRDFIHYEETVNRVIGAYKIMAICTYSLEKCGAHEIIDVVQSHQFALVKREGVWKLIESSERKRAEEQLQRLNQELEARVQSRTAQIQAANELLKLLSKEFSRKEYLDGVARQIHELSRCRCVGIRILNDDGTVPYDSYIGFSREFWESENLVCIHKDQCICTRVISGEIEPQDKPAMSPFGSFRSEDTLVFVDRLREEEKSRYRGVCVRSGFASVAVIPIRYRDRTIGAVHLADESRGRATQTTVEFIEAMTPLIGEAVHRFNVEAELRRNYEILRQNHELMENMFSGIHVMIAYLDRNFNFVRVNRAYAEADGRDPDFYPGKNHFDLYPYGENRAIFQRVVDTGKPYFAYERAFEYAEHPERGVTYWDWSLSPIKEDGGSVKGLVFTLIDVTERKRAEVDRTRLFKAVEEAAESVLITDTKGMIEYVNPAFERMTGYGKGEALGKDIHFLESGKRDAPFFHEIRDALRTSDVWSGTLVHKKKDGTLYHAECTVSPVRGGSGEIINYISITRDVTEKLRLESIAEGVDTMKSIGYIFTGIRHEMANPINAIKMTLSVLKANLDAYEKPRILEYIERAQGELSRVEYLLKNLKAFNMYENPEIQSIPVAGFMQKLLTLIEEDFKNKGITLEAAIAPDAQCCYADPRALQQVLLNILTNASDACDGRESPRIYLSVSRLADRICVHVEDTGCGMTEDEQTECFRPFYTTKTHGTGLGLVIARKTLDRMNGTIALRSRKNVGTEVRISLPEGPLGEA